VHCLWPFDLIFWLFQVYEPNTTHKIVPITEHWVVFRDIIVLTLILALTIKLYPENWPWISIPYYMPPYLPHTEATIPLELQLITFWKPYSVLPYYNHNLPLIPALCLSKFCGSLVSIDYTNTLHFDFDKIIINLVLFLRNLYFILFSHTCNKVYP